MFFQKEKRFDHSIFTKTNSPKFYRLNYLTLKMTKNLYKQYQILRNLNIFTKYRQTFCSLHSKDS
jgi:hypothetical protein